MKSGWKAGRRRWPGLSHLTMTWTLLLFLSLLLALPLSTALGIRPATTRLVAEETPDYSGTLWIVNNEGREFSVSVGKEGELEQYLTLKTEQLSFRQDDDAKPIDFELHLPVEVPPGLTTALIVVEEQVPETGPNIVSSRILLKHRILVLAAYPDKYLAAKLNFHEQGQEIRFVSEVENLGKKDLEQVQTTFYVNDKQQQAHVLETETTPLKKKENKLLSTTLPQQLFAQGEFEVSAVTSYDDQKVELVKKMIIGQPDVDITYFDQYFIAHKVNQYSLDLLNLWNQPLANVFVEVEVKKGERTVDSFRTRSVDLPAEMIKRLNDYFDARDQGPGKYTFEMLVNFWNLVKMEQKPFSFASELIAEGEPIPAAAVTGKAVQEHPEEPAAGPAGRSSALWLALWILLGVLLGATLFYVFWRYRHRQEYEEGIL